MFGGLHIEMAACKLLGDLLKGTGWGTALSQAFVLDLKRMFPPSLYPWHALLWLLNELVLAISASIMKC
jgi:hypothetical protein